MTRLRTSLTTLFAILLVLAAFTIAGFAIADSDAFADDSAAKDGEATNIYGTAAEYSTYAPGDMLKDSFYYSDDWFQVDPAEQNDSLALVSMQLTAAATVRDHEGAGAEFLKKLGFGEIRFINFESDNPDDCAYMIGTKTIGNDTIMAVVIQSYAFDNETKKKGWTQNFTVNGTDSGTVDGEHYAFSRAAESAAFDIMSWADDWGQDNVKFWIMGQSRGGAIANLIAANLKEMFSSFNGDIYAYTFEAPATVDEEGPGNPDSETYNYIHNYTCSDDIVPMVPPWGMRLYGQTHQLKTEETDAAVYEELEKLGSAAAVKDEEDEETKVDAADIIEKLVSRIKARADYTAEHNDTFTEFGGGEKTITFTWQEKMTKLMEVIFGDGLTTKGISERAGEIWEKVEPAVRAYLMEKDILPSEGATEWNAYYWEAAKGLHEFLDSLDEEKELAFSKEDLYAILKLAAPIIISETATSSDNKPYVPSEETIPPDVVVSYLEPGLNIAMGAKSLVFSHHFDTVIARLKALAPAPDMDDIDIEITEPALGDPDTKAPKQVSKAVGDMGLPWLDVSAEWDTDDGALKDDKKYYLKGTFYVTGHSVPDDLKLTVNGEAPATDLEVSYKNGRYKIEAAWAFAIGEPAEYTLTFDTEDRGDTPEPIKVTNGERLRYVQLPEVQNVEAGYRLGGWRDENKVSSDDMTITGDEMLFARWIQVIDKVKVSFTVPMVGQKWTKPTVTDNVPYHLKGARIEDSSYREVTVINDQREAHLYFNILLDSDDAEFLLGENEFGSMDFAGTVTINGQKADANWEEDGNYLYVQYDFKPLPSRTGADGTTLGRGALASAADKTLKAWRSNKDPKGAKFTPLKLKSVKQTKKSIKLAWTKQKKAAKYVIYGARSGSYKLKKITSVRKGAYVVRKAGTALKKGKYYKFIVVAVDKNKKVVSTSKIVHVATKGSKKAGNYKAVRVKVKKAGGKYRTVTKVALKKGGKAWIKATCVKASKVKGYRVAVKLGKRYESSKPAVATVSSKGVIKAVKKGTCNIYVFAQNGVKKVVKVTVR
ncbi:MAG: Ig-like domain-containing protein [Bacillota bacterium]|nr:Ig-like domain-containing protein [Bacillota bacterium]